MSTTRATLVFRAQRLISCVREHGTNKPVHLVFHRQPAVPIVGFVFARIRVVTGVVKSLRHGDSFGEKAILTGEKRNATCTAAVSASCTIWGRHFMFLPREQPPSTRFPLRIYLHRDVS